MVDDTADRALDRSDPLPLWAQLAATLRERIARGDFDATFPTEAELTARYGVSRHTVREAVARLRADGMLERQRGRGTWVTRPTLEQPLHSLYSLARTIADQGLDERSDVRALLRTTDAAAAARLGLPPRTPLVYLERVRHAGGEPLALDRSWLPAAVAAPLLDVDLGRGALYDALAERCATRVTGGSERIRPTIPAPADRAALELPAGEAALLVDRIAVAGVRTVEWRRTLVRGDRYVFTASWG
jgi:GntR family transcriptional regulator